MKILYIHHDDGNSGASRSLSFLIGKLDPEKYNAKINCIFNGPVLDLFRNKPVEIIEKRGVFPFYGSTVSGMNVELFLRNWLRLPQSFFAAIKLIRSHKPDLVHLNSSSLFMVALVTKLFSKKTKVVCHIREPLLKNSLSGLILKHMNYFFVDHFIAIDNFSGNSMKTRNNLSVVYNAVNFEDYNPDIKSNLLREELQLSPESIIFLYLARIAKCNGADDLVDVANKVKSAHPNFHFVIAGFNKSRLDKYAQLVYEKASGNHNIHLLPFRSDVPSLIASSDVLIVPFTEPHFARSIVEASALGKPSIGSNVGGVNELIADEQTGFLYNTKHELYKFISKLGTDKNLQHKMGTAAAHFAYSNFDNKISSKKVFKIYEQLLNSAAN